MSGESPREEKLVGRRCGIRIERPGQTVDDGMVIGLAITATQPSRQQLIGCDPLGQHGLCDVASARMDDATAADAAIDPCRPRASSRIHTMSGRFIPKSYGIEAHHRKLMPYNCALFKKEPSQPPMGCLSDGKRSAGGL